MFTGIITEVGRINAIEIAQDSAVVTIAAHGVLLDAAPGDSIAVDGVCLTVTERSEEQFSADVMAETLKHTNLGSKRVGDRVNLERALAVSGRLEGHIVQGHVDAVAHLRDIATSERWADYTFELPGHLGRYIAFKGSIALNGVSLTVTSVSDLDAEPAKHPGAASAPTKDGITRFGVSLIPTTLEATNLGALEIGDSVNVEVDILAKYVERMSKASGSGTAV